MANRSFLYSIDKIPDGKSQIHAIGLSECECNIPLIYRILVSHNPQAVFSLIDDPDDKTAIAADYFWGVTKLRYYIEMTMDISDRENAEKLFSFLLDPKNKQQYLYLDCAEIYAMGDDDNFTQNQKLIEELKDIDTTIEDAICRVRAGDRFDLKELSPEYWTNNLFYKI